MTNIYQLQYELQKLEKMRVDLQKLVLDANESAIADASPGERQELYKSHDMIIDFINAQSSVLRLCIGQIQQMYSKKYVHDLQQLISKQKFYIKQLGGNPSLLNYITENDLLC
jgi:hypothetical protein